MPGRKSARTKACAIPPKVKAIVWERDGQCCILCGAPSAAPNAHYIARSQGGLGIAQNIVTLCIDCHRAYDQTVKRRAIRRLIWAYLTGHYPGLDEDDLKYRKE